MPRDSLRRTLNLRHRRGWRCMAAVGLLFIVATSASAQRRVARFTYVVNRGDNSLSVYVTDTATGQLRAFGFALTGRAPSGVATTGSGRFVYVTNEADNSLSAFTVDPTSGRVRANGPVVAVGRQPAAAVMSPSEDALYVVSRGSNSISTFKVAQSTGALSPAGTAPTRRSPVAFAIDGHGTIAAVVNQGSTDVSVYSVRPDGALTPLAMSTPVGVVPTAVAVDPAGRFVFVAGGAPRRTACLIACDVVSVFAVDRVARRLHKVGGVRVPGAASRVATALALTPDGGTLLVGFSGPNAVAAYSVNPSTGAVAELRSAGSHVGTPGTPTAIAIGPSGHIIYVTNGTANDVSTFLWSAGTGLRSSPIGATMVARERPVAIAIAAGDAAVTPYATFAYLANQNGATTGKAIQPFRIAHAGERLGTATASGGELVALPPAPSEFAPLSVGVDPFERIVYAGSAVVCAYRADGQTGALTPILSRQRVDRWFLAHRGVPGPIDYAGFCFESGNTAQSTTVDPSGRFVYTSNAGVDKVSMSVIDSTLVSGVDAPVWTPAGSTTHGVAGGLIEPGQQFGGVHSPEQMTADPSGEFALQVSASGNAANGWVTVYRINPVTGALTDLTPQGHPLVGARPLDATFDVTGRFVYVSNFLSNDVSAFRMERDGHLVPLTGAGSPFATGTGPVAIAAHPAGRFLYVVSRGTTGQQTTISAFAIDPGSGALRPIAGSPFRAPLSTADREAASIEIDPSGSYLYVPLLYAEFQTSLVSAFAIDKTTGALTHIGFFPANGSGATMIRTLPALR